MAVIDPSNAVGSAGASVMSADDASSVGGSKDDDDNDDDDGDDDDKVEAGGDPERLKAFNVRTEKSSFSFSAIFPIVL